MDAIQLLNDAELPWTAASDRPYLEQLQIALSTYTDAVARLTADDAVSRSVLAEVGTIRTLSDHLLAVHTAVLNGRMAEARQEMERAIATVRPHLETATSVPLDRSAVGTLYRLRIAEPSESIDRGGMFHIPFDRRERVRPQRYSMIGIPMLYLGSTIFISLEELGRPPVERVWVSALRLRAGQTLRVINFGLRPALIAAMLDAGGLADPGKARLATAHAILWPLIAACSCRRRNPDAAFVEEYVIPQQLTTYLVETADFDGIRYFSNRVPWYRGEMLMLNFALPARPDGGGRYAGRLTELFEVTPPMPYHLVLRLGPLLNRGDPGVGRRSGILEVIPGHPVDYQRTEYSRVEGHLEEQDFAPVA